MVSRLLLLLVLLLHGVIVLGSEIEFILLQNEHLLLRGFQRVDALDGDEGTVPLVEAEHVVCFM